jgi:hypothetical protein
MSFVENAANKNMLLWDLNLNFHLIGNFPLAEN